ASNAASKRASGPCKPASPADSSSAPRSVSRPGSGTATWGPAISSSPAESPENRQRHEQTDAENPRPPGAGGEPVLPRATRRAPRRRAAAGRLDAGEPGGGGGSDRPLYGVAAGGRAGLVPSAARERTGPWRRWPPPNRPLPRPLSRASPTHPPRTREGRHLPAPKTAGA